MENTSNSTNQTGQTSTSDQTSTGTQSNSFNMSNITDMLGGMNIQESLKKYGGTAAKAVGKLSTTQKIIGGALLVLGAGYLSRRSKADFKNRKNN